MSFRYMISMNMVTMPEHTNPSGNIHGGEVMKLMDSAAAVAAIKYVKNPCVTLRADEMIFDKPVKVGTLLCCNASVVYTGSTSIEVYVEVTSESLTSKGGPEKAISAFFTLVAVTKTGKPKKVPKFIPETPEEIKMNRLVQERRDFNKKRRKVK